MTDSEPLQHFLTAQQPLYPQVVEELRDGFKRSHWMWFIFPQVDGLGHSPTARRFSLHDTDEARTYLEHPLLGSRLLECCNILLALPRQDPADILGPADALKLRSSMTLFHRAAPQMDCFARVLAHYYQGAEDERTLALLGLS